LNNAEGNGIFYGAVMKNTFALATDPNDPTKVQLWCEYSRVNKNSVSFNVINGSWDGIYYPDRGEIKIKYTNKTVPVVKAWEGKVPFPENTDYNDAMAWIEKQIK
jgi:hypothetical protein